MGLSRRIAMKVETLPLEVQAEVLDFVEFLASRVRRNANGANWTESEFERLAIASVVDEKDPVTYELSDCREVLQDG